MCTRKQKNLWSPWVTYCLLYEITGFFSMKWVMCTFSIWNLESGLRFSVPGPPTHILSWGLLFLYGEGPSCQGLLSGLTLSFIVLERKPQGIFLHFQMSPLENSKYYFKEISEKNLDAKPSDTYTCLSTATITRWLPKYHFKSWQMPTSGALVLVSS